MIHNPQQLKRVVCTKNNWHCCFGICTILCVTMHLHWWLYYLKRSLRFKYGLHTYNMTSKLLCSSILIANPIVYIYVK